MSYPRRFRSPWLLMAGAWGCLGALALTGCAAARFQTDSGRNKQLGLTSLMALDTSQTVTIGRSPDCLHEANPLAFFGDQHPSAQEVLITGAVYGTAHWLLGAYLDRRANAPIDLSMSVEADMKRRSRWKWIQRSYQVLTGLGHGVAVANNMKLGIRPFSTFECGAKP